MPILNSINQMQEEMKEFCVWLEALRRGGAGFSSRRLRRTEHASDKSCPSGRDPGGAARGASAAAEETAQ